MESHYDTWLSVQHEGRDCIALHNFIPGDQ